MDNEQIKVLTMELCYWAAKRKDKIDKNYHKFIMPIIQHFIM